MEHSAASLTSQVRWRNIAFLWMAAAAPFIVPYGAKSQTSGNQCTYGGVKYNVGSRVCQGGRIMKCQEDGTWGQTSDNCFKSDSPGA